VRLHLKGYTEYESEACNKTLLSDMMKTMLAQPRGEDTIGRAVPVDPMKPTFKAPGYTRLKLKHYKLLSSFAFSFNLRRYTSATRWTCSTPR
jgi:hypothetical protein